jgi:DNA-binding transcriptional regulator YiaG
VQRYQAVTPRRVVGLSHSSLSAWEENRSHPVN